jgi:hypothetical protein
VATFVDPLELSYRTFENIVPLDRRHGSLPALALRSQSALGEQVYTFSLDAPADALESLHELDTLGLYVPPLFAGYRGGKRFLFHSARLAEVLGQALREALPEEMLRGFSHVNPVFRCNRFEPGDEPFHAHLDNPCSDPSREHVSRYTLLLCLTGGTGAPALRIADLALQTLAPLTVVLFHQCLEHEGAPYLEGDKIFLRTELQAVDIPGIDAR